MGDLISRRDVIELLATMQGRCSNKSALIQNSKIWQQIKDLPSAQPAQTEMIKEIRKWINSGNRGSADYFIVDKIEEIINKYER